MATRRTSSEATTSLKGTPITWQSAGPWLDVFGDPQLSGAPTQGLPGHVPPGGDLDLNIGWSRFEHLLVFVAQAVLGLAAVKFRRYGTTGQAQDGIDLAGRRADGSYVVVQCKDYRRFTAARLKSAVAAFVEGGRPFGAQHLIVAVSTKTSSTQLEVELAAQQDANPDLIIELWGAEQINDILRARNDIVSRFWTRETADTFCTAAPTGGVAAPTPDWLHLSDMILLEPTGVAEVVDRINEADAVAERDPSTAADLLGQVAQSITEEGFPGHAQGVRRRQFDLLNKAGRHADVIELAAQLAVASLHQGHERPGQGYTSHIEQAVRAIQQDPENRNAPLDDATAALVSLARTHVALLKAAEAATQHPTGDKDALAMQLRELPAERRPAYFPALVLLLAELEAGDRIFSPNSGAPESRAVSPGAVEYLDDLITAALVHSGASATNPYDRLLAFRLRLMQARHTPSLRTKLVDDARMLKLSRREAALILAFQARRDADEGSPDDAMMNWRRAIQEAIHEGNTDDAAGWLYSVRGLRVRYREFDPNVNNEHYLAQGLPRTGAGSALARSIDHETRAYREAAHGKDTPAINAARRWLADSITLSSWADENEAVGLLGDLFARNTELERAALCYQWAGEVKKLEELANAAGDRPLPARSIEHGPWWIRSAAVRLLAVQEDLLEDEAAAGYLRELTRTVGLGRRGEITDPIGSLLEEALKAACTLAGRGTAADALRLLDDLAQDVPREHNHYRFHDREHVDACLRIAEQHPHLTDAALGRLFDLAGVGSIDALQALNRQAVLKHLEEPGDGSASAEGLSRDQRNHYRRAIVALDEAGQQLATVAACSLGIKTTRTTERVRLAAERLRSRPAPDPSMFSVGDQMVSDSYLVSVLAPEEASACLARVMQAAEDRGEAAPNRLSALIAARNLVRSVDETTQADIFERTKAFVSGWQDGSHLDDFITNPHPLSTFRISLGPSTLRGEGLALAAAAAANPQARNWVVQQALTAMQDENASVAQGAVLALRILGPDIDTVPDPGLLAAHPDPMVKMLGTMYAATDPGKYENALDSAASDPDYRVRRAVPEIISQTLVHGDSATASQALKRPLERLLADPRHSIRTAAAHAMARVDQETTDH